MVSARRNLTLNLAWSVSGTRRLRTDGGGWGRWDYGTSDTRDLDGSFPNIQVVSDPTSLLNGGRDSNL